MNIRQTADTAENLARTFDAQRGTDCAFPGPDGASKTPTFRMLRDIFKPDSGAISEFANPLSQDSGDTKVTSWTRSARDIAHLPEENNECSYATG